MKKDKTTRIVIIGAGAAGLTAAETLQEKGYQNVTLLEKAAVAGGKCHTIEFEGRNYELGAGIIAGSNNTILELLKKVGMVPKLMALGQFNLYDLEKGGLCDEKTPLKERIAFWWQLLLNYRRLSLLYQPNQHPGFANTHPDLFLPFSEWAKRHKLDLVQKNLECVFTGFGYGYWDKIPAAYVLKYYSWESLKAYLRKGIYTIPAGIQTLWKKIAKNHRVRYNTTIQQIQRKTEICIKTKQQELFFDELILACPLDEILPFLDASIMEKTLFSKIKYNDYQTYACTLEGFPQQTGFIPNHFHSDKKGHPILWYKRYSDSNFYTIYVLGDWQISESEIIQNIEVAVQKLGGQLKQIHSITHWKYFPHVSSEDMKAGFFEKLENMQGKNKTYYIGELPTFSMVELTAAYAKNLIGNYF